jgi:hypothetical protein
MKMYNITFSKLREREREGERKEGGWERREGRERPNK